uniref:Uncharacterized protein n=1 Tax=Anguilla anguilla TaxID=7936 RepID=A0A0E9RBV7_ANGAN
MRTSATETSPIYTLFKPPKWCLRPNNRVRQ